MLVQKVFIDIDLKKDMPLDKFVKLIEAFLDKKSCGIKYYTIDDDWIDNGLEEE